MKLWGKVFLVHICMKGSAFSYSSPPRAQFQNNIFIFGTLKNQRLVENRVMKK